MGVIVMPDITFDDLIKAKNAAQPKPEGSSGFLSDMTQDGLMQLASTALNILQEFKGIQGGSNVIASRTVGEQTTQQTEVIKPMVDTEQIKEALLTVKNLKGDITITSMLELLEQNKEAVAGFLKGK